MAFSSLRRCGGAGFLAACLGIKPPSVAFLHDRNGKWPVVLAGHANCLGVTRFFEFVAFLVGPQEAFGDYPIGHLVTGKYKGLALQPQYREQRLRS